MRVRKTTKRRVKALHRLIITKGPLMFTVTTDSRLLWLVRKATMLGLSLQYKLLNDDFSEWHMLLWCSGQEMKALRLARSHGFRLRHIGMYGLADKTPGRIAAIPAPGSPVPQIGSPEVGTV